MSLLQQAPRFDLAGAARLARDMYGLDASASALPSERDQNFLLATNAGDRYVLKVANATENRPMLEAQNAAMVHLADRVAFCPRVLPAITGDAIGIAPGGGHLVRLVTYLAGIPLAQAGPRSTALLESLGRAVGRLDAALADFDHPAIHRNFHWDLANAARVIGEHLPLILDRAERQLVQRVSASALQATEARQSAFRRSAVHNDANDWNVLVSNPESRIASAESAIANPEFRIANPESRIANPESQIPNPEFQIANPESQIPNPEIVGIIDFGDMVHSWTVADPAVAIAYAMLDAERPLATAAAIVRGYHAAHALLDEELAAVFPLACLRLCMSVCIAAWQQRQRPGDAYLAVSQEPIRRTLPALAAIPLHMAAQTLRAACLAGSRA
jgi:Ser/Thr protein kinase RdoA (MazF antagonist)